MKVVMRSHLLLRGEAIGCGGALTKNLELEMAQSVGVFDLVASVLHTQIHVEPRVTHCYRTEEGCTNGYEGRSKEVVSVVRREQT